MTNIQRGRHIAAPLFRNHDSLDPAEYSTLISRILYCDHLVTRTKALTLFDTLPAASLAHEYKVYVPLLET